jgi:hypothetical protein
MSDVQAQRTNMSIRKTLITLAAAIANLKQLDQNIAAEYDTSVFAPGITQIQITVFLLSKTKSANVLAIK